MDDLHYVAGDFYRICDRTGFKIRARKTSMEWNGLIVFDRVYERRQPQDFVKGVQDNQTVPMPRPRQVNSYLGPLSTTLTANVASHSSTLPVSSSARMQTGDSMTVMLDTGIQFSCAITSVPNAITIIVSPPLSYSASSGNLVTDLSAVTMPSIG